MSASLSVTKDLMEDHWLLTISVVDGSDIPKSIFVYTNSGGNSLGEYYGVCDVNDFTRLKAFTGEAVPVFGNRFLKHDQAKIKVQLQDDVSQVILETVDSVNLFRTSYLAVRTSTNIIPVI